ncbi:MAG: hypothetical protein RLY78_2667 [Pseudomonadota bacterium]|jgi:hypothetical protein|uniref:Uncharacterized protein n=1 Tax=Pseudaquabacterium rugosum TaxID=2984194 RepID=A0ABU9B9Z9_9BURK
MVTEVRIDTALLAHTEWRLTRTDAGRREIRERAHALPRAARNLLLIVDPARDATHWLAMVHGSRVEDLGQLLDLGLIATAAEPGESQWPLDSRLPEIDSGPSTLAPALAGWRAQTRALLEPLGYGPLYERLLIHSRERLGLIKAYRMTLAIERAADASALSEVAVELVVLVRRAEGEAAARELLRQLARHDAAA